MDGRKYIKRTFKKPYRSTRKYVSRVPRSIGRSDTLTTVKCEFYSPVTFFVGSVQPLFDGHAYLNVSNVLNQSASFQDMVLRYGRFKITGITIRFDSSFSQNDATSFDERFPPIAVVFYPHKKSFSAGELPLHSDQKAYLSTSLNQTGLQTYSWKFKDNYFESSSGGYGTWNNSSTFIDMPGQFSMAQPYLTSSANANTQLGMSRYDVIVIFSNKLQ